MTTALASLLPELIELVFFGLSSLVLTAAGVYIEWFALLTAQGGNAELGVWASVVGLAALYFAYLMSTDKFAVKLRELRQRAAESPDRSG